MLLQLYNRKLLSVWGIDNEHCSVLYKKLETRGLY